jgi:hypothetical protein
MNAPARAASPANRLLEVSAEREGAHAIDSTQAARPTFALLGSYPGVTADPSGAKAQKRKSVITISKTRMGGRFPRPARRLFTRPQAGDK